MYGTYIFGVANIDSYVGRPVAFTSFVNKALRFKCTLEVRLEIKAKYDVWIYH